MALTPLAPAIIPTFKLSGWQETVRTLETLRKRQLRPIVNKASRSPAKTILGAAKALAPIGETRELVRKLRVRVIPSKVKNKVGVRVRTGTREEMGIDPAASGYYPAAQEYGWKSRDGTVHKPNPSFMRPAYWQHRSTVALRVRFNIILGIDQAVEKGKIARPT